MNKQEIRSRQQERYSRGTKAEKNFIKAIKNKYPNCCIIKSTRHQDMFDHIDYYVDSDSYDIKSLKKRSSKDEKVNPNIIWIEFQNTRGNSGWLYGKATKIAFELEDKFITINREDLRKRAESLTINQHKKYPTAYHLYGRIFSPAQEKEKGYKCADVTTFIYLRDIEDLIVEEIPKIIE